MSESAPPPPADADARIPLFADPLAGWVNDDILLDKDARRRLGAEHPQALRVLDWPELRALFNKHEAPANHHARRDRRLGLASVLVGVAALVLAAFTPLAGAAGQAAGAQIAGPWRVPGAGGRHLALCQMMAARTKAEWLGSRYWTERARGSTSRFWSTTSTWRPGHDRRRRAGHLEARRAQALDALPPAAISPAGCVT